MCSKSLLRKTGQRCFKVPCMAWTRLCTPRVSPWPRLLHGNAGWDLHAARYFFEILAGVSVTNLTETPTSTAGRIVSWKKIPSFSSVPLVRLFFECFEQSGTTDAAVLRVLYAPSGRRLWPTARKIAYDVPFYLGPESFFVQCWTKSKLSTLDETHVALLCGFEMKRLMRKGYKCVLEPPMLL